MRYWRWYVPKDQPPPFPYQAPSPELPPYDVTAEGGKQECEIGLRKALSKTAREKQESKQKSRMLPQANG